VGLLVTEATLAGPEAAAAAAALPEALEVAAPIFRRRRELDGGARRESPARWSRGIATTTGRWAVTRTVEAARGTRGARRRFVVGVVDAHPATAELGAVEPANGICSERVGAELCECESTRPVGRAIHAESDPDCCVYRREELVQLDAIQVSVRRLERSVQRRLQICDRRARFPIAQEKPSQLVIASRVADRGGAAAGSAAAAPREAVRSRRSTSGAWSPGRHRSGDAAAGSRWRPGRAPRRTSGPRSDRRTPCWRAAPAATAPSEVIVNKPIEPVEPTCVPPHNSIE